MGLPTPVKRLSPAAQARTAVEKLFGQTDGVATALASQGFGGGLSSDPITWSVANKDHERWFTESTATSGDSRGLYRRHYLSGAGASGEAIRAYTTINAALGASASAHGIHASVSYGTNGTVTGQATAVRATLQLKDAEAGAGTFSAGIAELWADGASTAAANATTLAFERYVFGGDTTGAAAAEDVAYLFSIEGGSIASGNMCVAKSSAAVASVIRVKIHGAVKYLMVSDAI